MNRQAVFPNRETVFKLMDAYPKGCRVELLYMDDEQAPPVGTKGTVTGVDDAGSIMVDWDNGSRLHVAFGADVIRRLYCRPESGSETGLPGHSITRLREDIVLKSELRISGPILSSSSAIVERPFDIADPADRKELMERIADMYTELYDSPYDALEILEKEFKAVLDDRYLPFH